jgi:glutamate synthase (NADPH/NADH) small chain
LVAVILSAQCTDKRVNVVTERLFRVADSPEKMVALSAAELEEIIHSCGFYHNKAKFLLDMSADLINRFGGVVPSKLEELMTLAGVGRKTANVVYAVAFGGQAIAVDTHVFRVANRTGLAAASNVLDTEKQLMAAIDPAMWADGHHQLLLHGRYVCKSQKPNCGECCIAEFCDYYNKAEALRCLNCPTAPCKNNGCPVRQDIPRFMHLVKNSQFAEAYSVIADNNLLAGLCGMVCPHDKQCEGHCVRAKAGQAVAIGRVEAYVAKNFSSDIVKIDNALSVKKIAIVGAGPSGLTCAYELIRHSADVTVFDRHDNAGGVLEYGIPPFRIDKEMVSEVVAKLQTAGVKFIFNTELGIDITLTALSEAFDAVYLAIGMGVDTTLDIPTDGSVDIVSGNAFLKNPTAPPTVVVIGGGNVAMDCARTAARSGAAVTVAYRRTYAEMPAFDAEKQAALDEDVEIKYLLSPKEITSGSLTFTVNTLTAPDASGRAGIEPTEATETIAADLVINATGSQVDTAALDGIVITDDKVTVNEDMRAAANIFAGGDVVNNTNTVVAAVLDGKKAAISIMKNS